MGRCVISIRRRSPFRLLILITLIFFLILVIILIQKRQLVDTSYRMNVQENTNDKLAINTTRKIECQTKKEVETVYTQMIYKDVMGKDLFSMRTKDVSVLKKVCSVLDSCKGFNSNGWLKKSVSPLVQGATDLFIKENVTVIKDSLTNTNNIMKLEYEEMKSNLKIYIYDIDIGTNMKSPKDYKYGVESLFINLLRNSKFRTQEASEATFFFIPSRCTAYRYSVSDRDQGGKVAEETMKDILQYIKSTFPYWDRSAGTDHFYICSHDMGGEVTKQSIPNLLKNSIALLNTADYEDRYFMPHKDISVPPHPGKPPVIMPSVGHGGKNVKPSSRNIFASFAGTLDRGRVRPAVQKLWSKDPDFQLIDGMLTDENYKKLLEFSKFCLILRGHRVWSPRLMDSVWFGCVPVIIADYYHLPLQSVIDWQDIAVIIPESKVPELKSILMSISEDELSRKQELISQIYTYLSWNNPSQDYDAFHMVLYELWQRRHIMRYYT
uniref:Probable glycosyltransferase At5g11130-like n=1 Tax=Saccoglossus kowalevskii TaxID=10224 RepID=A0ABM0MYW6_SACKO|nr:PREDICTED: probable glycosyltransferase At5g11130-like [Saccoglossus kowalevskii]